MRRGKGESVSDVRAKGGSGPVYDEPPGRPAGARGRSDTADAFLPDPGDGPVAFTDDLAEMRGEGFLRSATSGEDLEEEASDEVVPEELGGPFLETNASDEFALGTDESNPEDAEPEPLPRAVHGLASVPKA